MSNSSLNKQEKSYGAYSCMTVALFASSIEPIIIKIGYLANSTPIQLLCIKGVISALLVIPFLNHLSGTGKRNFYEALPTCILFAATNALLFFALEYLSAVTLITIITTTPAFVALANSKLRNESLGPVFWIGFLMCFVGIILTLGVTDKSFFSVSIIGVVLGALAVFCSTTYRITLDRVTKKISPFIVSLYIFLLNGIASLVLIPFAFDATPITYSYGAIIATAGIIANLAFIAALKSVGSTRVSIMGLMQRPLVVIAAALILHEPVTLLQAFGITLVILGITFAQVFRRKCSVPSPASLPKQMTL